MVAREDGEVFYLVPAGATAVGAVVADQGAVAKQEEVRIRIEQGTAGIASEAVEMPPISSCGQVSEGSVVKCAEEQGRRVNACRCVFVCVFVCTREVGRDRTIRVGWFLFLGCVWKARRCAS